MFIVLLIIYVIIALVGFCVTSYAYANNKSCDSWDDNIKFSGMLLMTILWPLGWTLLILANVYIFFGNLGRKNRTKKETEDV